MKIICAGLQKTGTTSMAAALRMLGFTVHDYEEHLYFHLDEYIQAMKGIMPDFATMYSDVDVDATTDDPPCLFWKELKETFPDAKVILMERDNAEAWVQSVLHLEKVKRETKSSVQVRLGFTVTPTGRKWEELNKLNTKVYNQPNFYTDHNARVKAGVPRDDLLVFNLKQGWKPLCEFLGVEVPDVSFPRLNVKNAATPDVRTQSMVGKRIFHELVLIVTILLVFVAMVIVTFVNY